MKTRAQFLLMGLLSIAPLFPHESEARLFAARLGSPIYRFFFAEAPLIAHTIAK
jgi:hypothetical protein